MKKWELDDTWQRSIRDKFLTPFYKRICVDGRFVYFHRSDCSTLIQKRHAVDTALQLKPDYSSMIEEKIVRQSWSNFFFETDSCTLPDKHSDGWMCYAQSDMLLYAFFCQEYLDTYIIHDFQDVKQWFWQVYTHFTEHTMPTDNRTRGRLVPIRDVTAFAKVEHLHIFENGKYEHASNSTTSGELITPQQERSPLLTVEQVSDAWEIVAKRTRQKTNGSLAAMLRLCKVLAIESNGVEPTVVVMPDKQAHASYINKNYPAIIWALNIQFGCDCDFVCLPPQGQSA